MDQKEFDSIIKAKLIKYGKKYDGEGYTENDFCYRKGEYENYFSEAVFKEFVTVEEGNLPKYTGGELSEKGKRKTPPKMASVGSSSRFCYLALKDWVEKYDIKFEKECKIEGIDGGAPQLDAFISKKNVYVEAKCHEIFSSHTIVMSTNYKALLKKSFGLEDSSFEQAFVKRKRKNPAYKKGETPGVSEYITVSVEMLKIEPKVFGVQKEKTMFDIKQFLCHLMGIASQKQGKATLVYLFFKPLCDNTELNTVFKNLQTEIGTIFKSTPIKTFCKKHNIDLCAIVESASVMETLTDTPKNYDEIIKIKYSNN